MTSLDAVKYGIDVLKQDLENYRYMIIDLIEQNIIKGSSTLKPIANIVMIQIVNLVNFLEQMKRLIE